MSLRYSLVIPVHNEEGNIAPVAAAARRALDRLGAPYEVLFVDDASSDLTAGAIRSVTLGWPECRALSLPSRRGQALALLAGLVVASGEILLTMDGDGQDDAGELPVLVEALESRGLDLVCGWRRGRLEPAWRLWLSRAANAVRRAALRDGVHDAGCQLRAMRRAVVASLRPVDLMQAFVPSLACAAGFRVGEAPVHAGRRISGSSKYGLSLLRPGPLLTMLSLLRSARRGGPS